MTNDKRWIELSVETEKTAIDDLINLLSRYCSGGTVVEERPAARALVKGFIPEWEQETAQKLEIALLLLGQAADVGKPNVRVMAPEDWSESWKAYFEPQHIGKRTVIVPTWRNYTPKEGEMVILLDPGMAFGTGLHATTRLCLAAIEEHACAGLRAIDVGTGSGILSIALAKQGVGPIVALDIDPVAVHVAKDNLALNQVTGVNVQVGTLAGPDTPADVPMHTCNGYDLMVINIFADVIIALAPAIAAALKLGGTVIASGIISAKSDSVAEALQEVGFDAPERRDEDDWVALVARKC